MRPKIKPGFPLPTHHISLSDGEKTIGLIAVDPQFNASPKSIGRGPVQRTALKTTTGETTYSDFNYPWTPTSQSDFSGGRGNADFEKDTARYFDAKRANTVDGKIVHGPLEHYTKGYRNQDFNLPGSLIWSAFYGNRIYLSKQFSASNAYSAINIYLWIRHRGSPGTALTVALCSDNAGSPGNVLQSTTVTTATITDVLSEFYKFVIASQALVQYTTYWIKVYSTGGTIDDHWEVGCSAVAVNSKECSDGATWISSSVDMYYRIADAETEFAPLFFRYKNSVYMLKNVTGAAPTLYINGDRGVADANTAALTTLIDGTKSWATDKFVGDTVWIIGGLGVLEPQRWRKITANNGTTLTLDSTWTITHDTTTEYVIISNNIWTLYAGAVHGLTGPVSSVWVINGIAYFAQGESIYMRRMRWTQTAGAELYEWAADGTNYATYLCSVRNPTSGLSEIWKANNGSIPSVSSAATVNWATNLVFTYSEAAATTDGSKAVTALITTNIQVGMNVSGVGIQPNTVVSSITNGTDIVIDKNATATGTPTLTFDNIVPFKDEWGQITNICEYGTTKYLWVFREGSIYALVSSKPDEIPLGELHTMMTSENGKAVTPHNVYLYFSWGSGLERYYNSNLDDIGPNRDEGLPTNRQGTISKLVGYPNRLIMSIDAGAAGYSSVLMYNQTGYHEIYRAPVIGQRIRDMIFQTTPGSDCDKLWLSVGSDILWLSFPSLTVDPTKDANMEYTHEVSVESAWIYCNIVDIYKYYQSLKIFAENLVGDAQYLEFDVKFDNDSAWTTLVGDIHTTPNDEIFINDDWGIVGKRMKWRLRSYTTNKLLTPKSKAVVIETVSRVPVRYSFALNYRIEDLGYDQQGEFESRYSAEDLQKMLDSWAENLIPLTMRSIYSVFDNKRVFIDPIPINPIADAQEKYVGKLSITVMKNVIEPAV